MSEISPPQRSSSDAISPLDRPARSSSRVLWAVAAVGVHAALLAGAALVPEGRRERPARRSTLVSEMIEVQLEESPPSEPEEAPPEPEEAPPEPEPAPPKPEVKPPPVRRKQPEPEPQPVEVPDEPLPAEPAPEEAPAPEAAEAAEVLTAEPDEPVDFGDTFVAGNADAPVGGASAAGGTAKEPVRDPNARGDGVPGGTGTAPAPTVDRSRPPGLAGGAQWDCPFPREADFAGIDEAAVVLGVKVDGDGQVQSVSIHDDPGHGFGREARRCALRKRWRPGLDEGGHAVGATVHVRVRFHR